jgi:microcystin-dependent protein
MDRYIGQIMMFAGNFAPEGWALCDGQLLPIADQRNQPLFSIIGTMYGGNGVTNFALPDLRGRLPMHAGSAVGLTARQIGDRGGSESFVLGIPNLPRHGHALGVSDTVATELSPCNHALATIAGPDVSTRPSLAFGTVVPNKAMHPDTIGLTGEGVPVSCLPPFQAVNFIIAIEGEYPSRG